MGGSKPNPASGDDGDGGPPEGIRGAIMAVDGVGILEPIVLRAIREVTGRHYRRIVSFNDNPNTDHAQVVEVLARARMNLAMEHLGPF